MLDNSIYRSSIRLEKLINHIPTCKIVKRSNRVRWCFTTRNDIRNDYTRTVEIQVVLALWIIVEGLRKAVGTEEDTALALAKRQASASDPPSPIFRSQTTDMTTFSAHFDVCWATRHSEYLSAAIDALSRKRGFRSVQFIMGVAETTPDDAPKYESWFRDATSDAE